MALPCPTEQLDKKGVVAGKAQVQLVFWFVCSVFSPAPLKLGRMCRLVNNSPC